MPVENDESSIRIRQFDPGECTEGAMDNGETFATSELGDGVQAVMCKRSTDGGAEVQSLIFDKEKFPDEDAAKAWATEHDFKAWSQRKQDHETAAFGMTVKYHDCPFTAEAGAPGLAADPENPKASEGMENFRMQVQAALDAAGWTIFGSMEPKWDFAIMELFTDSTIVIDMMSGEHYRIGLSLEGDKVVLGDPEKYDITFTPSDEPVAKTEPDGAAPTVTPRPIAAAALPTPPATERIEFRSSFTPIACKTVAGKHRATYDTLITQSGWTKDGRYLTAESLKDAVTAGLFDGTRMYWQHRDDEDGSKPHWIVCGYIKAGSARLQANRAGGVDVWGHAVLLNTSIGTEIKEVVEASLDSGEPLIGTSIRSKSVEAANGTVDGRNGLVVTHFNTMDSVDFVEDPAYPRAGVKARLAASAQRGNLTMDEKLELERLRRHNLELAAKVKRMETETEVDKALGESGMPADRCSLVRPILLSIDNKDVRTAQLELSKQDYWRGTKGSTKPGGATDGNAPATPKAFRADVQAAVDKAAKAVGLTAEQLAKAQLEVMGAAE